EGRLQQREGTEEPSLSKQENESVGGSARPGSQGGGGAVNPPSPRFTDSGPAISPPDDRTPERISPSELPKLLRTSAEGGGVSGSVMSGESSSTTQASLVIPSITPEPALQSEREILAGANQPHPTSPRSAQGSGSGPEDADPKFRKKPNPYAMVPSLYDLYEQSPMQGRSLERFGASVFANGTGNVD